MRAMIMPPATVRHGKVALARDASCEAEVGQTIHGCCARLGGHGKLSIDVEITLDFELSDPNRECLSKSQKMNYIVAPSTQGASSAPPKSKLSLLIGCPEAVLSIRPKMRWPQQG
jgi:hypothetical protein